MKEIVICSGKGGTGKTSLAAAFARLRPDAALADCDVDAANLSLMLQTETESTEPFVSGVLARVEPDLCRACGLCAELCRFDAIHMTGPGSTAAVDALSCEGCGLCAAACPHDAITLDPTHCGDLLVDRAGGRPLVHASMNPGAENSGKLVMKVRGHAKELAEAESRDLILTDGPPGIGCPVIASISGADLVVAVCEPTLASRHDLERLLDLASHFSVPAAVIVNKADLCPELADGLSDLCAERATAMLGRIPYDETFYRAQREGRCILDLADDALVAAITKVWRNLENHLTADRQAS